MALTHELKKEDFRPSENVGTDISLKIQTQGKSAQVGLNPPRVSYLYMEKYYSFGVTAPEGAVIPQEIIEHPLFKDAITIFIDPSVDAIAVGDTVRVFWAIPSVEDYYEYQSKDVRVEAKDKYILITLPDTEALKFVGKQSIVNYYHVPQAGEANFSPAISAYVAPPLGPKPILKVTGVVDGVLNTEEHPDGIKVIIDPIANMHRYNALEIRWTQDSGIWVDSQHKMTVYPDQSMEFTIPPVVYQPHVGKHVLVRYFIFLGANMSPNLRWSASTLTYAEFDLI